MHAHKSANGSFGPVLRQLACQLLQSWMTANQPNKFRDAAVLQTFSLLNLDQCNLQVGHRKKGLETERSGPCSTHNNNWTACMTRF
jgi:hypothetical protein